ncbi:hypothetical protein IAR50_001161 [Cryptococcus sp. DSM 104548]
MDPFDYFGSSGPISASPFAARYPRPVVNTVFKKRPQNDFAASSPLWSLPTTSRASTMGSGAPSSSSQPSTPSSSVPKSCEAPRLLPGISNGEASQERPSFARLKPKAASKSLPHISGSGTGSTALAAAKVSPKRHVSIADPASVVVQDTPKKRQRREKAERERKGSGAEMGVGVETSPARIRRVSGVTISPQGGAGASVFTAIDFSKVISDPPWQPSAPLSSPESTATPPQPSSLYDLGSMGSSLLGKILPSRSNQPSLIYDLQNSVADLKTSFQSQLSALDERWQSRLEKLESDWAGKVALAQLELSREKIKAMEAEGEMKEKVGRLEGAVAVLMRQSQEQQRQSQELQRQHESQLSGLLLMASSAGVGSSTWPIRHGEATVGNLEQTLSTNWTSEDAILDLTGLPAESARDEEKEVLVHSLSANLVRDDQGQASGSFFDHSSSQPTHNPAISPRVFNSNYRPYVTSPAQPTTGAPMSTLGSYNHNDDEIDELDGSDQDGEHEIESAESLFGGSPPPRPPPRKAFPSRPPHGKAAPHAMDSLDSLFSDRSPEKRDRPKSKAIRELKAGRKPNGKDRARGTWDNPQEILSQSTSPPLSEDCTVAPRATFKPPVAPAMSPASFRMNYYDLSCASEDSFDDASSHDSYSPGDEVRKALKVPKPPKTRTKKLQVNEKPLSRSGTPELPPGVTLPVSDGSRRTKGRWPNKKGFSIVGTMQEIVCDWCHGRCHWACAGLSENVDMSKRDWFCTDCKYLQKVKGVTRKEYVDRSQEERCIRFNCILLDDIPEEAYQEEVFVVQRLVGRRTVRKFSAFSRANSSVETEWLVFWDGYGLRDCSWEVRKNLAPHDKKLIADFDAVASKEIGVEENERSSLVLLEEAKSAWSVETGDAIGCSPEA